MTSGPHAEPSPSESGVWGTLERPCPSERTLAAHVDSQLDAARSDAVEAHLDDCPNCASVARRVEGLSSLLRAWETRHHPAPPSRLASAVLRTVAPEAAALRRESVRASTRAFAFAAAVLAFLLGGCLLGFASPPPIRAAAVARLRAAAPGAPPAATTGRIRFDLGAAFAPPLVADADPVARPARDEGATASASRPFADEAAARAFANWLPYLEAQRRMGEDVYVVDGRALPATAAGPYARLRRLEAWYADRTRRADERVTLDPSDRGFALLDVLPLPAAADVGAFLSGATTLVDIASRKSGGLVVRPLPSPATGGPSEAPFDDLLTAVAAGRVALRPDARGEASIVTLDVQPAPRALLVPSGELIAGGAGDRVVAEGIWLAPSEFERAVVLRCVPVSRLAGSGGAPVPTGLVAGPELRGLIAYRAEREGVLALVDSQIADAALDRGSPGRRSLLALYDRAGADVAAARATAATFVAGLGEEAAGFVASDPNGRFQGVEYAAGRGASGRALLERLLTGYLIEARTRTALDAPRSGASVDVALARLAEGAPRLRPASTGAIEFRGGVPSGSPRPEAPTAPPAEPERTRRYSGQEPRTGVRLEGLGGDATRPLLVSGLVPGLR